jgi:starch synthase
MTKVLSVASEVYPLLKTGGLADVAGALPGAMSREGVDMRVLVPGYPAVLGKLEAREHLYHFRDLYGGAAELVAGTAGGLRLIVLDAPHLYDRPGNPYLGPDGADWADNWQRFAALARVAAEIGQGLLPGFMPEVVHGHDWQAALSAVYLAFSERRHARSVLTIHNLAFQGNFPAAIFPALGLPSMAFAIDGVEYYGGVGYLKGGLQTADAITTVSPSYAREICTPAGGMGLDGVLRARGRALSGIVNGVDTEVWDPATDASLAATYSAARLQKRAENRAAIEARFGLEAGPGLIFTVVSRLTWQKGLDLLGDCVDGLVGMGARLAVLGAGEASIEAQFRSAAARHPGRVGFVAGYDEPLAHLLQGGADAIVIPSRFEPCGLTQFYGLRYGCVPVVARVGGLADTIIDANDAALSAKVATGIQFLPVDPAGLMGAIGRTVELHRDPATWRSIQSRGMKSDVSWQRSAARYAAIYAELIANRNSQP